MSAENIYFIEKMEPRPLTRIIYALADSVKNSDLLFDLYLEHHTELIDINLCKADFERWLYERKCN